MSNRQVIFARIGWILAAALLSAGSLWACSVPVFRYAFEHWAADDYQAVVFHRGPLSEANQRRLEDLGERGRAGRIHANVVPRTIDLDQNPEPATLDFWRQLNADSLPWLVLRYPPVSGLPENILSAPLTDDVVERVLESPVRREIARRLGEGQSAVWLLLESGDQAKDDAAHELLNERLDYLTGVLELPALDAADIANGLISVDQDDLKLQFSTMRLSRDDPDEGVFVSMLLGVEADLRDFDEPIVFPLFGRGRALYALIGKGINHATIDEAAMFLIGSCSCEVKELNPGTDVLMAADWDGLLQAQSTLAANDDDDDGGLSEDVSAAAEPVTVTVSGASESVAEPSPSQGAGVRRFLAILCGVATVGLAAAAVVLFRRRNASSR